MSITREVYVELYPQLMRYALSICKEEALAEDLVSQTMLKAVETLNKSDSINDLSAWCVTVLKNKFFDHKRKKIEDQLDDEEPQDQKLASAQAQEDPFAGILYQDCIAKLDPNHAEVMLMNNMKGLTAKVIAEVMNKPQNTILTWLSKARAQFVDCVEGAA